MLIDSNVHLGTWPFAPLPEYTAGKLVAHLSSQTIGHSLVSHLGAVFLPDPMPANRKLFKAVKSYSAFTPVPVINPTLATWREHLETCLSAAPIRAVKIFPNYHNYRLTDRRLDQFVAALDEAKLKLILNVRLADERTQYFALRIKGIPPSQIASFLLRFTEHHPLLTGIYRPELKQLSGECENFSADIAYCEWRNTIADLLTVLPPHRLLLGTCSPLLSTRAQVDKLRLAGIPAKAKILIGSVNAKRFFRL